ncbi:MAG: methionine--tRNA ligase [Planctomycetota bacterium]|nr:methionine--tRNA ligase [Planctomycetota bacterium]
MTRHLVTSALPYANGPIHFGHVAGAYLPADVYVRYLRMKGEDVLYVCGTDEHGVAITLKAEKEGLGYAEYVDGWRREIKALFDKFEISFDIWSGTSRCPQHAELSRTFFTTLLNNGLIFDKTEDQWYSEALERYLPDRYLEGGCPECGHEKARGDECPRCGAWIDAKDLVSPTCTIDGSKPVLKATKHWFLDLPKIQENGLQKWYDGQNEGRPHTAWKPNVHGYVQAMLKDMQARPITRDLPWGVPLPEELAGGEGKVLYVWFDAPIGYISATMEWAEKQGKPDAWKTWWQSPDTQLSHFIGKDNIAFHMVVFPSMLLGQGDSENESPYVLPWSVPANEFYNLQGRKFSTSEGWHLNNEDFFSKYSADAARFHLILSGPESADSEFTWEGFQSTNNALLADKLGNFSSRVLKFAEKRFEGKTPQSTGELDTHEDLMRATEAFAEVGQRLAQQEFKASAKALMKACDALNEFFDSMAPWKKIKSEDPAEHSLCAATIERCIAYLELISRRLAPFCPSAAKELRQTLGAVAQPEQNKWGNDEPPKTLPAYLALGEVGVLFPKIDNDAVQDEINHLNSAVQG